MDVEKINETIYACQTLNDVSLKKALNFFRRSIDDKKVAVGFERQFNESVFDIRKTCGETNITINFNIGVNDGTIERTIVVGEGITHYDIIMRKDTWEIQKRMKVIRFSCNIVSQHTLEEALTSFTKRIPAYLSAEKEQLLELTEYAKEHIGKELKYSRRGENAELRFLVKDIVFEIQAGEGAWKRSVFRKETDMCIEKTVREKVTPYVYEFDEINTKNLGKVILEICGNEGLGGDPFLDDIRSKIQTAITEFKKGKYSSMGSNMQVKWWDDDFEFYVVRAGEGKHKFTVSSNEKGELSVDKEK